MSEVSKDGVSIVSWCFIYDTHKMVLCHYKCKLHLHYPASGAVGVEPFGHWLLYKNMSICSTIAGLATPQRHWWMLGRWCAQYEVK